MDTAKRTLNMIRAAFLFAIAVYMFVGERVAVGKPGPVHAMLFQILAVVAVVNVVVRKSIVTPALAALRANANDMQALNRWRGGFVVTYALCEASALYGFIVRIVGFSYTMVV